ncbi:MAG: glycosyltransferase [Acidobacteriota bacterium]|nr:glycosyltransferase [Acidobacteriota bacterium]
MPDLFLLEDASISGTARLVMAHADALIARGQSARIVTAGAPPAWRASNADWVYVEDLRNYRAADDERVVEIAKLPILVDDELFRANVSRENDPLRVLLCGSWDKEAHGIEAGYGAVAHARWFHQKLDLIRVSPWAPSREEPVEAVQEFHVALTAAEMTRLMHSCDVLIAPNRREDRLPLPTAEGLASSLACVMTATPIHRSFDELHDYALFAPEDNAIELGERLIELLDDGELRERLRTRGREVAEQWRVHRESRPSP